MPQTKLTDYQFTSLMDNYYDPGPRSRRFPLGVAGVLEQVGYIELDEDKSSYHLTQAGREYIDDFRKKVESRDLTGTTAEQRVWLVISKLNSNNDDDRNLLLSFVDTDRSRYVREAALYELRRSGTPISGPEWNRFAHNKDKRIRRAAAAFADPMEYAEESDEDVIGMVIRVRRDGIPRKLVSRWYERNVTAATAIMDSSDIDRMIDDRNFDMLRAMAGNNPKLFTTKQGEQVKALFDETGDARLRDVLDRLLRNGCGIPADVLFAHVDDPMVSARLEEYRKAYIHFREAERMFADPDCWLAREQRRIADTGDVAAPSVRNS